MRVHRAVAVCCSQGTGHDLDRRKEGPAVGRQVPCASWSASPVNAVASARVVAVIDNMTADYNRGDMDASAAHSTPSATWEESGNTLRGRERVAQAMQWLSDHGAGYHRNETTIQPGHIVSVTMSASMHARRDHWTSSSSTPTGRSFTTGPTPADPGDIGALADRSKTRMTTRCPSPLRPGFGNRAREVLPSACRQARPGVVLVGAARRITPAN